MASTFQSAIKTIRGSVYAPASKSIFTTKMVKFSLALHIKNQYFHIQSVGSFLAVQYSALTPNSGLSVSLANIKQVNGSVILERLSSLKSVRIVQHNESNEHILSFMQNIVPDKRIFDWQNKIYHIHNQSRSNDQMIWKSTHQISFLVIKIIPACFSSLKLSIFPAKHQQDNSHILVPFTKIVGLNFQYTQAAAELNCAGLTSKLSLDDSPFTPSIASVR